MADLPVERVKRYLAITERALKSLKVVPPKDSHNRKIAEDFLNMAKSYYSDACHFFERGDYADAFACVNYAHGWLDAGARLGLWDVSVQKELFTVE